MLPTPLVSVAFTLRCAAPELNAVQHISLIVSSFLDASLLLSLQQAAATGSLHLFRRVLTRLRHCAPPIDEFLMVSYLSKSMVAAVNCRHLHVAQYIHEIHPGTLPVWLPHRAAKNGDIPMMQWLIENRRDQRCVPSPDERLPGIEVLEDPPRCCLLVSFWHAVNANQFAAIKWLVEHGSHGHTGYLRYAGDKAACVGDLGAVQWLHEINQLYIFTTQAIAEAARGGHTEVVAFLLANRTEGYTVIAQCYAVIGGNEDILELLQSSLYQHLRRGPPSTPDLLAWEAAKAGRYDLIPRDSQAGKPVVRSLSVPMGYACEQGRLDAVEWMVAIDASTLGDAALRSAAENGHLHILQWVHELGMGGLGGHVLYKAAESGHLHIVQWFHQHYSNAFASSTMDVAAARGHQQIVEWLHLNRTEGCSQDAMNGAAKAGHLKLIQWLHEHRMEGCTTRAMDGAASSGHHDVVKWLHEHRTEGCTTAAVDGAAIMGDLELVMWLHRHRSEGCTTRAMDEAPLCVVKWLHFNRTEGCSMCAMARAAATGDLAKIQFL